MVHISRSHGALLDDDCLETKNRQILVNYPYWRRLTSPQNSNCILPVLPRERLISWKQRSFRSETACNRASSFATFLAKCRYVRFVWLLKGSFSVLQSFYFSAQEVYWKTYWFCSKTNNCNKDIIHLIPCNFGFF